MIRNDMKGNKDEKIGITIVGEKIYFSALQKHYTGFSFHFPYQL
jgi:hypothetical protein